MYIIAVKYKLEKDGNWKHGIKLRGESPNIHIISSIGKIEGEVYDCIDQPFDLSLNTDSILNGL